MILGASLWHEESGAPSWLRHLASSPAVRVPDGGDPKGIMLSEPFGSPQRCPIRADLRYPCTEYRHSRVAVAVYEVVLWLYNANNDGVVLMSLATLEMFCS